MGRIQIPDFDDFDDGPTGDDEDQEMCGRCGENPATASDESNFGRLAVCPDCATDLVRLAAQAVAEDAKANGADEAGHRTALNALVMQYCYTAEIGPAFGNDIMKKWLKERGKAAGS